MQTDPMAGLMGGGGGPAPSISVPSGAPPSAPGGAPGGDPSAASASNAGGEDKVTQALDLLREAASAKDLDHDQKMIVEKMTTLGQQLLTENQKLQEQAVGGGPAAKLVRRHTLKQKAAGGGRY